MVYNGQVYPPRFLYQGMNQMALQVQGCLDVIMDFLHLFQTGLSLNIFEQAAGHTVLQTFSGWVVKSYKQINDK